MSTDNIPLFRRICTVEIDGMLIDTLRVSFKVEKDLQKEPNRAHIKVYNLSQTTRTRLQRGEASLLKLRAGYENTIETVFYGDITRVDSYRDDTEWVTEFSVGDGIKAKRSKRAKVAMRTGKAQGVMATLLAALGKGEGNLRAAYAELAAKGRVPPDLKKWVATGGLHDAIEKMAEDHGLHFSIQDNAPAFAKIGSVLDAEVVVLTPSTGLLGSPELTKKGYVKAKALIQQRLLPGRGVEISSAQVRGLYQIHKVTFDGDTRADPWFADLELVQVLR